MLDIRLLPTPHSFAANTYLISSNGEYAVVDPATPFSKDYFEGELKYVLLTHAHFDHILDIDSWVKNGAKVIISADEAEALSDPMRNCFKLFDGTDSGYFGEVTPLTDGESIRLGDHEIRIMVCPGHTIGSAAYLCDRVAFVGDTVFAGGSFGRYDLPTGNYVMLRDSIRKLADLPEDTMLYPGHGEATSVRQFKKDFFRR